MSEQIPEPRPAKPSVGLAAQLGKLSPRVIWPLAILALAIVIAALMRIFSPELEPQAQEKILPGVRVVTVQPQAVRLKVRSQGTVKPRIESNLISEVSGRITFVAPPLVAGGHFDEGDLLLEISEDDYRNAADRSRAAVERERVEFENARTEFKRQERLRKQGLTSQSQLDTAKSIYKVAEAGLREARIALQQAETDLSRTKINAPFKGRVRSESVDVGQFVARGETVAELYADDSVEVRLPIASRQLAYLDIPPTMRGILEPDKSPAVKIFGELAGQAFEWQGALVRAEAAVDERTRMFYGVARVENPSVVTDLPPLAVGLFVRAEIDGQIAENIVQLPRSAMRDQSRVLVVDEDDRLHFRDVELLRVDFEEVLVQGGLNAGERVCVSPLQMVVEGMKINPIDVTPQEAPSEPGLQLAQDDAQQSDEGVAEPAVDSAGSDDIADPEAIDSGLEETAEGEAAAAVEKIEKAEKVEEAEKVAEVAVEKVAEAVEVAGVTEATEGEPAQ